MTTDIIEINNFIVLIEQSNADKTIVETCDVEKCDLGEQVIGFSFYGSGNVELEINYGNDKKKFNYTTGIATSFFGNSKVKFAHKISNVKPLKCISIFSTIKNVHKLPEHEKEIFTKHLDHLINPKDDFVEGPFFYMTPDMQNAVYKIFGNKYEGTARTMFLRSQVIELLSHFFALLSDNEYENINKEDREKLFYAKEILSNNIEEPPSLNKLSKLIGLNNYKLKKNFKELFGVPVFKYLQNERLNKAHELLSNSEITTQQAALHVGYESLGSFSNAYFNKFGFRPSKTKK